MHRRHLLASLPAALLMGCDKPQPAPVRMPKVKWRVACTTSHLADISRNVGGDAVEAISIPRPGMSPHQFLPIAPDIVRVRTSDIVLLHGMGLESKWSEDWSVLKKSGILVESVGDRIPKERLIFPQGPAGPPDPHVWTDPELCIHMASTVAEILTGAMPQLEGYFASRTHSLIVDIERSHSWVKQITATLKPEARFVLTSHDSIQYFARAYGFETRSLATASGLAHEALPESLTEWIQKNKINILFREQDASEEQIKLLLGPLNIPSTRVIYSLALAAPKTQAIVAAENYDVSNLIGVLRHTGDLIQSNLLTV